MIKDILANLFGKGWAALASVLFVPFFIRFLGVESYGLVGFFFTLQTVLLLLDFGFSTTLNRELSAANEKPIPADVTALALLLERVFACSSLLIALLVLVGSPWIVSHWIVLDRLSPSSVETALRLMGACIALQLPFMLYAGGLTGLARQTYVNWILAVSATIRFGGALLVLSVIPEVEAFFVWQLAAAALQTFWARRVFFRELRSRSDPALEAPGVIRPHLGFATGVGVTAALGVILTQLDKLMLSNLLPLADYGYYMMAWTLSAMLFMLAGPVATAFFPRLSAEVSRKSGDPAASYHAGCQLLACAVMPAGALLMLFPTEILVLWIGEHAVERDVATLLTVLALGTLLNTLAQLPHALQLAFGRPRFGLYANLFLVLLVAPALYFAVETAGARGAAWVWVALNAAYSVIGVPLMHCWLLKAHFVRWLGRDVLLPLGAAFSVVLLARVALAWQPERSLYNFAMFALSYMAAASACLSVSPNARDVLRAWRRLQPR